MTLLKLHNLVKHFGGRAVVDDVSFDLEAGEFLSILGKSGSGKTTLLRLIAGFERVDSGEIVLDNKVISSAQTHVPTEKRDIGIVFQDHALWPHMTIFDNVAFPLKVRKMASSNIQKAVMEALTLIEMQDFARGYPHQLSGGEAQRVALARSLVQKPKLIIFDEPLASLDAVLRYDLQTLIKTLHHKHNLTCIYITHDQTEAMRLSDRIVILENGKILQLDKPEAIYRSPATASIARLIGQGVSIPVSIEKSDDVYADVRFLECTFSVRAKGRTSNTQGLVCVRSNDITVSEDAGPIKAVVHDCSYIGGAYQIELKLEKAPSIYLRKKVDAFFEKGTPLFLTLRSGWLMVE